MTKSRKSDVAVVPVERGTMPDGTPFVKAMLVKSVRASRVPKDVPRDVYRVGQLAEPLLKPHVLEEFTISSPTHGICVAKKARLVAGLGIKIITKFDEREARKKIRRWETTDKEARGDLGFTREEYKEAKAKLAEAELERQRLQTWIDNANDDYTLREIIERGWRDFESTGSLNFEVLRDEKGEPARLNHISPLNLRVAKDGERLALVVPPFTKNIWFKKYGDPRHLNAVTGEWRKWTGTPGEADFEAGEPWGDQEGNEILRYISYSPKDVHYGIPGWYGAMADMLGGVESRDFMLKFFSDKAVPMYAVLLEGGSWSEETILTIQNFFRRELQGNYHATLALEVPQGGKITFQQVSPEPRWWPFILKYREHVRDVIVSAHGLTPALVGVIETAHLGGGCVREGTLVFTDQDGITPIERVVARLGIGDVSGTSTFALNPATGAMEIAPISKTWKFELNPDQTRKIRFSGGREIETSDWHPFYVFERGKLVQKRADEIKTGDKVASPTQSSIDLFPNEYTEMCGFTIDEELAWLAGYTLGDGSYRLSRGKYPCMRWYDSCEESIQRALRIASSLRGKKCPDPIFKNGCWYGSAHGDWLKHISEIFGLKPGAKKNLAVPDWVTKSPVSVIGAFLSGLLDSDGTVDKRGRACWTTENGLLMEGLAATLNLLGYRTSFSEKEPHGRGVNKTYTVVVHGKDQREKLFSLLRKYITNPTKHKRLGSTPRKNYSMSGVSLTYTDVEPLLRSAGITVDNYRHSKSWMGTPYDFSRRKWLKRWMRGDASASVSGLIARMPDVPEKAWIENVLTSLVEVKSIGAGDGGTFYDFSVENLQNYPAGNGGFVVAHNTGADQMENTKTTEIKPRQETLEWLLNRRIVSDGLGLHLTMLKFDEIDTQDEARAQGAVSSLYSTPPRPALTTNEARKMLRLPPVEDDWADEILVQDPQYGLLPMGQVSQAARAAAKNNQMNSMGPGGPGMGMDPGAMPGMDGMPLGGEPEPGGGFIPDLPSLKSVVLKKVKDV